MNNTFIIKGGKKLSGQIDVQGSKNAALALLAASLITEKTCRLKNVPEIEDINKMVTVIESLGAIVNRPAKHEIEITAEAITTKNIDCNTISEIRASIQIIGALVSRVPSFTIVAPGGCKIGSRSLDAHLDALTTLGCDITTKNDEYIIVAPNTLPDSIVLSELSPTATVNVLLASARSEKSIIIYAAAQEYPVQEVCWFLETLGVRIEGIGTHTLRVTGSKNLRGSDYTIMPDPIEVGTLLCLAGATRSEILIKNSPIDFLRMELELMKKIGVQFKFTSLRKDEKGHYTLSDIVTKPSTKLVAVKKIHNMPAPGINPDLLPPLSVLMTQASGTTLIHDWMYDGRFAYIKELQKMGASAHILNPHQALIIGPTPLYGKEITSFDLRAGATLIIAALTAAGKTVIDNIYQVDRGYEELDIRLKKLGADIKRK